MRKRMGLAVEKMAFAAMAFTSMVFASCVTTTQATMLGPSRPPLPSTCEVQVMPMPAKPAPPFVNLASARASCAWGRGDCFEALRRRTCSLGGNLIYDLTEPTPDNSGNFMTAMLAWRDPSAPGAPNAVAKGTLSPGLAPGSVTSEATLIGPPRASRPLTCEVTIAPATPAPSVVNLALARVSCLPGVGADYCIQELRYRACVLGGNLIYGLSQSLYNYGYGYGYPDLGRTGATGTFMTATVAWRAPRAAAEGAAEGAAADKSAAAAGPPGAAANGTTPKAAAATCAPICSPGFDCQGGRCVPLCNPACRPTEICNMHRTCEPPPPARP